MEKVLHEEIYLICMVIVGVLWYWTARRDTRSMTESWLIRLQVCFLCNFLIHFASIAAGSLLRDVSVLTPVLYALKTAYYLSLGAGVLVWYVYGETELISASAQKERKRKWLLLLGIPPLILILANLKTHSLFSIDGNGEYGLHAFFHIFMAYLILCSLPCSVRLLIHAHHESDPTRKTHLRVTAAFPLSLSAAWLLSLAARPEEMICVCVTVELLCLFIAVNEQQISKDKLTQVNNRHNLMGFLNSKIVNHTEKLYLMMLDIDDFKQINDTWGHLEGDHALVCTASVLKRACMNFKKRPYIARYGGDEFIVVLEGNDQDIQELCNRIHAMLKGEEQKNRRYALSLSIGISECREGMDPKNLIAEADEALYREKKKEKREQMRKKNEKTHK